MIYRADGQWFIDYAAFGIECGEFGMDSIVRIGVQAAKAPAVPARRDRSARRTSASSVEPGSLSRETSARAQRRSAVA